MRLRPSGRHLRWPELVAAPCPRANLQAMGTFPYHHITLSYWTVCRDNFYGFLVSENGTYPTDPTTGFNSSGFSWNVPQATSEASWNTPGYFGHMQDYNTGATGHTTIEGHLIRNLLGNPTGATTASYPLRGQYIGDPNRGWAGPYITSLPKTDPWGDK